MYYLIGGVIVLILVLVLGKAMGFIGKTKEIEVEFAKTKKTNIVEKVSASGTVQPVIEVKLAPEVSGEIIELTVEDGDSVKAGQTLIKIGVLRVDTEMSHFNLSTCPRKGRFTLEHGHVMIFIRQPESVFI